MWMCARSTTLAICFNLWLLSNGGRALAGVQIKLPVASAGTRMHAAQVGHDRGTQTGSRDKEHVFECMHHNTEKTHRRRICAWCNAHVRVEATDLSHRCCCAVNRKHGLTWVRACVCANVYMR
jgi:hypothetical protein